MSYSYAAAEDALILIEATGLCEIERRTIPGTKEKEPSRYTVAVTLDDIVRSSKNYCRLSKSWKNEVLPRVAKNSPKNSSKNIKEREQPISQEDALSLYENDLRFAHKDVKGSLSRFFKGKKLKIKSVIEGWLTDEHDERIKPRDSTVSTPIKNDPQGWQEWLGEEFPEAKGTPFSKCQREHPDIVELFTAHKKNPPGI